MWLTWGALSLLVIDGALQASGAVEFTSYVWVLLALTLVLAMAVDGRRRQSRVAPVMVPAQRQPQHRRTDCTGQSAA
jgi:hypothetical protein